MSVPGTGSFSNRSALRPEGRIVRSCSASNPTRISAAAARSAGVLTRVARFDRDRAADLVADGWSAGLVVLNHALAHVDDPVHLLEAVRAVLAPGGLVAAEFHSLLGIVRDGQFDVVNHAHSTFLSVGAALPLFQKAGLDVVAARTVPAYGGSIRLYARARDATHDLPEGLMGTEISRAIADERSAGIDDPATLEAVGNGARRTASALIEFLRAEREAGRRVLGYGAPARGATLLNLAGVDTSLLEFTVDQNPAKQGRLLAGSRIPVLAPGALEAAGPDVILVLPWTLADEIGHQLGSMTARGTRLAVAMPALRFLPA